MRIEPLECLAESVAFSQDGDPAEARLKPVQHQLFPQRTRVTFRHAPFLIVIIDVKRIAPAPGAAFGHIGQASVNLESRKQFEFTRS